VSAPPPRRSLYFLPVTSPPRFRVPLVALVALALATAPAVAARRADGEQVVVTGIVADGQGAPIPRLTVVLEVSRAGLDLRRLSRQQRDTQRLTAATDERGEYSLAWRWSAYYNHFELLAAVPVRKPGGEKLHELQRVDITRRVTQGGAGSPVVAALTVQDTAFLDALRGFLAGLSTDDERRVHEEMGKPDTVETVAYPAYREVSWWYFEAGKVYRFRDGALVAVVPFDPIRRF
jgi:hypothetical protein